MKLEYATRTVDFLVLDPRTDRRQHFYVAREIGILLEQINHGADMICLLSNAVSGGSQIAQRLRSRRNCRGGEMDDDIDDEDKGIVYDEERGEMDTKAENCWRWWRGRNVREPPPSASGSVSASASVSAPPTVPSPPSPSRPRLAAAASRAQTAVRRIRVCLLNSIFTSAAPPFPLKIFLYFLVEHRNYASNSNFLI